PPPLPSRPSGGGDGGASGDSGGARPRIAPGSGATGAEQIPAAQDPSTVPDLAPPPEPATTP
ncbi:MAG TPA: hypothetical protein VG474_14955, partial [Solirubrobacteraceae bacterium]|nr:hypothetical protein [Solirubrobacteraceae bacterium]